MHRLTGANLRNPRSSGSRGHPHAFYKSLARHHIRYTSRPHDRQEQAVLGTDVTRYQRAAVRYTELRHDEAEGALIQTCTFLAHLARPNIKNGYLMVPWPPRLTI